MNQVSVYAEVINLLSHMSPSESVGLNADANVICLLRCYTALPLAGDLITEWCRPSVSLSVHSVRAHKCRTEGHRNF